MEDLSRENQRIVHGGFQGQTNSRFVVLWDAQNNTWRSNVSDNLKWFWSAVGLRFICQESVSPVSAAS